jgi:membrane protein implicated in regulation of membrane protease activity
MAPWLAGGSMAAALALGAAAVLWSWPLQVVAGALQLLGLILALRGLAVVRSWLERAVDQANEAKEGFGRWWALRRERLRSAAARSLPGRQRPPRSADV